MKISDNIIFINFDVETNIILSKKNNIDLKATLKYQNNYVFKFKDIKKHIIDKDTLKWLLRFKQYNYLILNFKDSVFEELSYKTLKYEIKWNKKTFKRESFVNEEMCFSVLYPEKTTNKFSSRKIKTDDLEYILLNEIFGAYQKEILCDICEISINTYNKYLKDIKEKKYLTNYSE